MDKGGTLVVPSEFKGPKQDGSVYPGVEEFEKQEGKDYNEKPDLQPLGTIVRHTNQDRD